MEIQIHMDSNIEGGEKLIAHLSRARIFSGGSATSRRFDLEKPMGECEIIQSNNALCDIVADLILVVGESAVSICHPKNKLRKRHFDVAFSTHEPDDKDRRANENGAPCQNGQAGGGLHVVDATSQPFLPAIGNDSH